MTQSYSPRIKKRRKLSVSKTVDVIQKKEKRNQDHDKKGPDSDENDQCTDKNKY